MEAVRQQLLCPGCANAAALPYCNAACRARTSIGRDRGSGSSSRLSALTGLSHECSRLIWSDMERRSWAGVGTGVAHVGNGSDMRVRADAQAQREQLQSMSTVVTDDAVPEGHKGLHGFLYGEAGADVHDSGAKEFLGRDGEDDGSSILDFEKYVANREGLKFSGVYEIYDKNADPQYVGYSRNVLLSLKSLRSRIGNQKCAFVRVKLYSSATLISRAKLEEVKRQWLEILQRPPPGNSTEKEIWEGASTGVHMQLMSEEERQDYEEKKLKMRKAMGENLHDDVSGEDDDSRTRRLKLVQATEGDDWSSVIDGQTKATVKPASISSGEVHADTLEKHSGLATEIPVHIVSPFAKPVADPSRLYAAETFELTVENVDMVLNEVRPYLIADGGNVEVVGVQDGVVSLRLQGACGTCPSSTSTMKMGIERVLNEKFGETVKEVVQVDRMELGASVAALNSHLDMLRPAIHNYGGFVEVMSVETCSKECVVKYKGPAPIGMGIQAAIKDKFPDIITVILVDP